MIILSGGTGTPKLLNGLMRVYPEEDISVIVNTAEDLWLSGNLICPDVDSVLYTLSGLIDDEKWWGIKGDTFRTHVSLKRLSPYETMMLGDIDRATHIARSELIRRGKSLTEATAEVASGLGIKSRVLPMSNEHVSTIITTPGEVMHFQRFWVELKGKPTVTSVSFEEIARARPSESVIEALRSEDVVIIGPSNPITSISPILSLKGMVDILKEKFVVAVSPIIGKHAVSGPAGKLMAATGFEVSSLGVYECYKEFLNLLVVDVQDDIEANGSDIIKTDTMMTDVGKSKDLASFIIELVEGC
ncbi:MAG: 2-phospho-L-lactate transferase [Halobacteriota archaeon]|nr:2-phospho-L-lactate transferase [Halobacteriota archaeon]